MIPVSSEVRDVSKSTLIKSESDTWLLRKSSWGSVRQLKSKFTSLDQRNKKIIYIPMREELQENSKAISSPIIPGSFPSLSVDLSPPSISTFSPSSNFSPLSKFSPNDIVSSSEIISPPPHINYFTTTPIEKTKDFKSFKLVEELKGSEDVYTNSLRILLKDYLTPLFNNSKITCGVPLFVISKIIEQMLETHESFLASLSELTKLVGKESIVKKSIDIANSIETLMNNFYLYIEYCDVYEDVLELSKTVSDDLGINQVYVSGLRGYLEATQPPFRRLDLSFMSLIQRPTARFSKYRLFLEALVKTIPKSHYYQEGSAIEKTLTIVKEKLDIINLAAKESKDINKSILIKKSINFDSTGLSISYFGKPLLIGSLVATWVESDNLKTATLAVISFKSHLILCDLSLRRSEPLTVKFIIPLARCNLITETKDSPGGLYSNYPYCFKLVFEIGTCQYEILFAAIQKQESKIWTDLLEFLVNFVNGPYAMDFSNCLEELNLINQVPQLMSPYNVSLRDKMDENCYFSQPIPINIFNIIYEDDNYMVAEYRNIGQLEGCRESFELTSQERIKAEKRIGLIWSEELPRIMYTKRSKLSRHLSLLNFQYFPISQSSQPNFENPLVEPELVSSAFLQPSSQFSFKGTALEIEPLVTAKTHVSIERKPTRISRASSIKSSIKSLFKFRSEISKEENPVT